MIILVALNLRPSIELFMVKYSAGRSTLRPGKILMKVTKGLEA
jgi:hypothetical protein